MPELPRLRQEGAEIFLPTGFIEFLAAVNSQEEITANGVDRFVGFYVRQEAERRSLDGLYSLVQELETGESVEQYNSRVDPAAPRHFGFRHYLFTDLWPPHQRSRRPDYVHLPRALFDEWVFLQEYSWLLGNNRHPFDQMVRAGGIALQWGKRHVDMAMRKTRDKEKQDPLTKIDRLIALGKWVAIGGITAVDVGLISISPPAGLLYAMNVVPASLFFMIDP